MHAAVIHSQLGSSIHSLAKAIPMTERDENAQYEERLQRRLRILKDRLKAGKVSFSSDEMANSLKAVRELDDGRIDLSTVDGRVRSMALAVEAIHDREETKALMSLREIQHAYFEFLELEFGPLYKAMRKKGANPHTAARAVTQRAETKKELAASARAFVANIREFWTGTGDIAHLHVSDLHGALRGVYGGDLFPSPTANLASKCGLYTDTLILPDPFLRSQPLFDRGDPDEHGYFLIKHGLNLLQYKELALADVSPPIVVVLPDMTALEDEEKQFFYELGKNDAAAHAARIFGRSFATFEEVVEFVRPLDTIERVVKVVADGSKVLFDTDWGPDVTEQLKHASGDRAAKIIGTQHPGVMIASSLIGRMGTSNELLGKAARLHGTPVLDVRTSWQYLAWKLENDADGAQRIQSLPDLHVLQSLQSLSDGKLEWIGKIPPAALIELRKTGALDETRAMLRNGVEELATASPLDFEQTSGRVVLNLRGAFRDHGKQIAALRSKKWKFAKSEVGSWLVTGSLGVTAVATGTVLWGLAAFAADQLLDAPRLREIPKSFKKLADESKRLRRSPVGLLFEYGKDA